MMEYKPDPYAADQPHELFDIPAAEQEITVGSNEQIVSLPTVLSSFGGSLLTHSSAPLQPSAHNIVLSGGGGVVTTAVGGLHSGQLPRGPRVIMLQRSSVAGGGSPMPATVYSSVSQKPGMQAVKIITVPGQGTGGKPLKAAVIPMHMLQRSMKLLPSSITGGLASSATSIGGGLVTSVSQAVPRVLAIRSSASQMTTANTPFYNTAVPSRSTSLLLSNSGTQSALQAALAAEEAVESHGISGTAALGVPGMTYPGVSLVTGISLANAGVALTAVSGASGHQHHPGLMMLNTASGELQPMAIAGPGMMTTATTYYYDMATGLPAHLPTPTHIYGAHGSQTPGRESGDEQEHVNTGLKTNGLRRYARCVCNKVKEKGTTSYSEVADELVHEYAAEHPMIPSEQLHYIQKNIRRRVYDALNVLMALNVLQKEKKEIRWVGLPVNMIEECRRLEEEREKRQVSLRNKTVEIQDLILQLIAFKNLVMRNRINERYRRGGPGGCPETNTAQVATAAGGSVLGASSLTASALVNTRGPRTEKIPLPFLVISTHRKTVIDCNISNDKLEYLFNFDQAFEIRDEVDTLKRMGLMLRLGTIHCTQDEYNQCLELVPPSLRFYVEAIYERRQAIIPDFEALHQQRRLFVEARLAAAAAAEVSRNSTEDGVGQDDDEDALLTSTGRPMPHHHHGSGHYHHADLFDTAGEDNHMRQLYLTSSSSGDHHRASSSSVIPSSCFVPGDTQHYARAAASRGYVVPGGPGGLLRHRQSHQSDRPAPGEYIGNGRSAVSRASDGVSLLRTVVMGGGAAARLLDSREEDMSAAATLVSSGSADPAGDLVGLMDTDEHHHGDEDDDDDDEDMEEV